MTALQPWNVARAARCAFAILGVLVFFTWLDNYAHLFLSGPTPVHLVWAFVGAAAVLIVLGAGAPMPFLRSPLLVWAGAFFLVTTVWAVSTVSSPFDSPALRAYYRSVGFLAAFAVIFDDPRARRVGALTVAAAVVFASCLNLAELFEVVRFSGQEDLRVAGRSGGLYVNANDCGTAIVFGMAVAIGSIPRAWRIPLLVIGAAGVAATFSRGAAICLAALIPLLVWRKQVRLLPAALVCVLVGGLWFARGDSTVHFLDKSGLLTADTSARLHLEQDDSGRVELAQDAWRMFLDAPLLGNGLGATVQAHNEFLTLAGDHGILGLLLFPALALALAASNPGAVPFSLVLLVAGFFSHNLLDDRASLLAMALAAATPGALDVVETPSALGADARQVPVGP